MMKNKYLKGFLLTLIALLVIGGVYTLYAKKYDKWPFANSSNQSVSPTTTNTPPPQGSTVDKQDEIQSGSDPSPPPVRSDSGGKSTVGIILGSANKNEPNLQVRAVIQTVTASGECTLTLTKKDTQTVRTYNAGVQALSSTSTCKGFDVPLSDLSPGTWGLSLVFENDSVKGETSKDINI